MPASVIIPAYRAAATIEETVRSARQIPAIGEVIVVDDGSRDATSEAARAAGADSVITLAANEGKGAALLAGIAAAKYERLLLLDADLGASAVQAGPLVEALAAQGAPGMSVAVLPTRPGGAGFGIAMRLARITVRLLSGQQAAAPMSGQRAITADLVRHIGVAPRFGVEVGLTVEAAHVGAPVSEVPLPLEHVRTGRDLAGFLHRGRQFRDILSFLLGVGYGLWWPALRRGAGVRVALLAAALGIAIALGAVQWPAAACLTALAAFMALALWLPVLWLASVTLGLRKPNYLGQRLPSGAGLLYPVVSLPLALLSATGPHGKWPGLLAIGAFGALGLVDDLFASGHQARGLRGHLRAVLKGRVTTGAIKAIGGLATGVAIGFMLDGDRPWLAAVDALVIALSANTINLLDLRPGRALKGFAMLTAVSLMASPESIVWLGPPMAAAIVSAPADLGGRAMMGDVGANVLGAAAGLALAVGAPPWARVAAVAVLAAFHVVCERASLTRTIEAHPALRFIDRLGTTHLAPLATDDRSRP